MSKQYIVTGESEDGWFLYQMNIDELKEYLAVRTGGTYEEGDPIDFEDLEQGNPCIGVDCEYYKLPHEDLVVIDGDLKTIKPKELVTEVSLE